MLAGVAYRKTSLIDFPGRVAAVLFLPGCNYRCPYCHNAELVDPGRASGPLAPLGEFFAFLDRRRSLISGLVISGGEPLLHAETPRIAAEARGRGLAIKLDTNGFFPERIEEMGADYVALDFKTAPSAYARVSDAPEAGLRVVESLKLLRSLPGDFEVRITCAPGIVDREDLEEMGGHLRASDTVILQSFRPGACLDPLYDVVAPHSDRAMEELLALLRRHVPGARIRGRS